MHKAIQSLKRVADIEMDKALVMNASWHRDFKDSAYVIVSGLNFDMNEGDVVVVFSQYGEIADVLLMRDKKTKKSRGFAFVCYVDQRSTDLAVDNFNGISLCGRTIKVDHVKDFKLPKEYTELKDWENIEDKIYRPSGPDGKGWGVFRQLSDEEVRAIRQLEEQAERAKQAAQNKRERFSALHPAGKIDQDELWEENLMRQMKAFEPKGLDETREKVKAIKKELRKEKKKAKKDKREKKDKKDKKDKKEKSERKEKKEKREKKVRALKEASKD